MSSTNNLIITNRPRIINFPISGEVNEYSKMLFARYKEITNKVKIKKYIYEDVVLSSEIVDDIEYSLFSNTLKEVVNSIDDSILAYHNPITYDYLKRRKVTDEQIFNYKIIDSSKLPEECKNILGINIASNFGDNPTDSIFVPIKNLDGIYDNCITNFIDADFHLKYSQGIPGRILFNKLTNPTEEVIITEGLFDVLALENTDSNFNWIATLSSTINIYQLNKLGKYIDELDKSISFNILYDRDKYGYHGALILSQVFKDYSTIYYFNKGKDIDEYLNKYEGKIEDIKVVSPDNVIKLLSENDCLYNEDSNFSKNNNKYKGYLLMNKSINNDQLFSMIKEVTKEVLKDVNFGNEPGSNFGRSDGLKFTTETYLINMIRTSIKYRGKVVIEDIVSIIRSIIGEIVNFDINNCQKLIDFINDEIKNNGKSEVIDISHIKLAVDLFNKKGGKRIDIDSNPFAPIDNDTGYGYSFSSNSINNDQLFITEGSKVLYSNIRKAVSEELFSFLNFAISKDNKGFQAGKAFGKASKDAGTVVSKEDVAAEGTKQGFEGDDLTHFKFGFHAVYSKAGNFSDNEFEKANKVVHKVESEWHYERLTKYGWVPTTKEEKGFVRAYIYTNPNLDITITASTGASADYWNSSEKGKGGYASDLEPYLKSLSTLN